MNIYSFIYKKIPSSLWGRLSWDWRLGSRVNNAKYLLITCGRRNFILSSLHLHLYLYLCLYLLIKCWRCDVNLLPAIYYQSSEFHFPLKIFKYCHSRSFVFFPPSPYLKCFIESEWGAAFEFWNNCVSQRQAAFVGRIDSIWFDLLIYRAFLLFSTFPQFSFLFCFSNIVACSIYWLKTTQANYHSSVSQICLVPRVGPALMHIYISIFEYLYSYSLSHSYLCLPFCYTNLCLLFRLSPF